MSMRKVKRLERVIDTMFNNGDYLLQTEVVLPIYLTMLTQSVEDTDQPMLSFDGIKDALEHTSVPLNLKLSVKKQLTEQGYIDDDVISELLNVIKGEI